MTLPAVTFSDDQAEAFDSLSAMLRQSGIDRYVEKGYVRIDPVILGGFHPGKRLDWSSKAAKQFQADAVAYWTTAC